MRPADAVAPDSDVPHVNIDHCQSAIDAAQYLISRDRRIAPPRRRRTILARPAAPRRLRDCVAPSEYRTGPQLIRIARGTDYGFGVEAAGALMPLESTPSAVFAASDTLAIGAINAFRRVGRTIPEGIAVIGFGNIPLSEMVELALTTIEQPTRGLARQQQRCVLRDSQRKCLSHERFSKRWS